MGGFENTLYYELSIHRNILMLFHIDLSKNLTIPFFSGKLNCKQINVKAVIFMDYKNVMPKLKIGDFTVELPIIQGGMSVGVSLSNLSSSVAKEGGIGVIGAAGIGMLEEDFAKNFREANKRVLKREIEKAKKQSEDKGLIGVNIMVALSDFEDLVITAFESGADLIFAGAGLPIKRIKDLSIEKVKEIYKKVVPIVSSAKSANVIFKYWDKHYGIVPNAVVVEGPLAGGHLGFKRDQIDNPYYKLENIVKRVKSVIKGFEEKYRKKISLIAAGGIYTGKDIFRFINEIGVDGVQMGTRFVATEECDADISFKESYVNCKNKDDIVIIDSPVGLPGRTISNQFVKDVKSGKKKPFNCKWKCLKTCDFRKVPYCIALALTNAKLGYMKNGFAFAGANAYRVDRIMSVKELIKILAEEYYNASISMAL